MHKNHPSSRSSIFLLKQAQLSNGAKVTIQILENIKTPIGWSFSFAVNVLRKKYVHITEDEAVFFFFFFNIRFIVHRGGASCWTLHIVYATPLAPMPVSPRGRLHVYNAVSQHLRRFCTAYYPTIVYLGSRSPVGDSPFFSTSYTPPLQNRRYLLPHSYTNLRSLRKYFHILSSSRTNGFGPSLLAQPSTKHIQTSPVCA